MGLQGLQQPVDVDVLEALLPDGYLEVMPAVSVDAAPEVVGGLTVSKQNVEEGDGPLFLPIRLHLSRVDPLGLVEDAVLHVESEEGLDAPGCQFALKNPLEPELMGLLVDEA